MKSRFPTAQEYSSETARHPAMTVVDIRSEQAAITDAYRNQVLFDVNEECVRMSVFEGEYRWHHHPDSDEFFLVVTGELQIDFAHGTQVTIAEWQSIVIPAGTTHRTRAIGRVVNITFEKQCARTVFSGPPAGNPSLPNLLRGPD
ncbi:MAG: cupin domain-containing protein [Gammaproteobacteria bacterium]